MVRIDQGEVKRLVEYVETFINSYESGAKGRREAKQIYSQLNSYIRDMQTALGGISPGLIPDFIKEPDDEEAEEIHKTMKLIEGLIKRVAPLT